jgi:hypothetical protein
MVPARPASTVRKAFAPQRYSSSYLAVLLLFLTMIPLFAAGDAPPPEVTAILNQYDAAQAKLREAAMRQLTDLQKTLLDKGDMPGVAAVSQAIIQISGRANPPATAPAIDLKKGLVLAFRFDKDDAGGKVVDSSAKANHGKAVGAKWTAEGRHGGGFKFGPVSNYITVPNNPSVNPQAITMAAWIKTDFTDKVHRRIFDKGSEKGYDLTMGGIWAGKSSQGQVLIEGAKGVAISDVKVADGKWHHVAGTFANGELRMYVDGAPSGAVGKNATIGTTPITT